MTVIPDPFRALGDPTRRHIIESLLRDGPQPVTALTARAGVSQPAVSQHLGILRDAGFVTGVRSGRSTLYSARPEALQPIADWVALYTAFWHSRIDRLSDLLDRT